MKPSIACLFMITLSLFPYCKASKYTPETYPKSQIIFGSGGGVTGHVSQFHLFENGTLFKAEGLVDKMFVKVGRLPLASTDQLFKNYENLGLSNIDHNHPGNLYYFFEMKKGQESHRITWGTQDKNLDSQVTLFYDLLNHHKNTIL